MRLFIARMVLDGRVTRMSFLIENVQVLYGSYYVVLSVGQFQPCDKKIGMMYLMRKWLSYNNYL